MSPIDPLRDTLAWPVQPVPSIPAIRTVRDLQPWSAPEDQAESSEETKSGAEDDLTDLSRSALRPRVAEVMTREVIAIESHRTLSDLEALLQQHHISGVPVVETGSENLVGVVSQSDIVRYLSERPTILPAGYHETIWFDVMMPNLSVDSADVRVSEIMTPFIHYATEDATVAEVLDVMLTHRIHRVVITKQQRLTGVVTSMDLLRLYRDDLT